MSGAQMNSRTTIVTRGARALRCDLKEDQGILNHYSEVKSAVQAEMRHHPEIQMVPVITGEAAFSQKMPPIPYAKLSSRIARLHFLDDYLIHGGCPEVGRGLEHERPLTFESLLPEWYIKNDAIGAIFHAVTHTMYNLVFCYRDYLELPVLPFYLDKATSRPVLDDKFGLCYRYFFVGQVDNWLGDLDTKFACALTAVIAILEDWPEADQINEYNLRVVHQEIAPVDLAEEPWCDLMHRQPQSTYSPVAVATG
jgi:hypothetical protein